MSHTRWVPIASPRAPTCTLLQVVQGAVQADSDRPGAVFPGRSPPPALYQKQQAAARPKKVHHHARCLCSHHEAHGVQYAWLTRRRLASEHVRDNLRELFLRPNIVELKKLGLGNRCNVSAIQEHLIMQLPGIQSYTKAVCLSELKKWAVSLRKGCQKSTCLGTMLCVACPTDKGRDLALSWLPEPNDA